MKENETKKKISSNDPRTAKIAFYKHFTQDLHRNLMCSQKWAISFQKIKNQFSGSK